MEKYDDSEIDEMSVGKYKTPTENYARVAKNLALEVKELRALVKQHQQALENAAIENIFEPMKAFWYGHKAGSNSIKS